ncbi:MAG TPA: hypothetical protein VFQ45_21255 [Longimicrobium sp.]|nr:hypothetical protein [Longimicrobium sp.]
MATVTLMNWNVQNYGPTKSGRKYNNYDVVKAMAKEVVEAGVDILCLLEVNTTSDATAAQVCAILLRELKAYAAAQGRSEWKTCVISPNTGREYYAFFVRDTAFTIPMPISGQAGSNAVPQVLGGTYTPLASAIFTGTTAQGVVAGRFPFLLPDRQRTSAKGRALGLATWLDTLRRPVLGLFYVPTAAQGNEILPILACHYSPDADQARSQVAALPYFSLLWGVSPNGGPPVQLTIDPTGQGNAATATSYAVATGDFNVDYQTARDAYDPLVGNDTRELDGNAADANVNTHLVTYAEYSRSMTTTADLAVSLYDNFFTIVDPAATSPVTFATADVYTVPEDVRNRRLALSSSVQHYAELDQRGFQGTNTYQDYVTDYARQIAGDPSHLINVKGSLVGGRLISDHLPVTMQLTV